MRCLAFPIVLGLLVPGTDAFVPAVQHSARQSGTGSQSSGSIISKKGLVLNHRLGGQSASRSFLPQPSFLKAGLDPDEKVSVKLDT